MDVFIPAAPKDYNKIIAILNSVSDHLEDITAAKICAPTRLDLPHRVGRLNVQTFLDDEVLPFDKNRFVFRPGWMYQQFLKLLQNVTEGSYYLVMDADIFINHPIPLFTNGHPILYTTNKANIDQFNAFNLATLGFSGCFYRSFVSELTLYHRDMLSALREHVGFPDRMEFINHAASLVSPGCFPAESVLYGAFVTHMHPLFYEIGFLNNSVWGKYGSQQFGEDEIQDRFREMRERPDVDVFSLHSWEGSL